MHCLYLILLYCRNEHLGVCVHGIKRGLPSLMKTKTLPASPLEIRRSSSRYVVSNHDWAFLFEIENFNGGWLEMVLANDEAVSWTEESMPLKGERSIFCPKNSIFSGKTSESVTWGVPIIPSSNLIWTKKGKKCDLEPNPELFSPIHWFT